MKSGGQRRPSAREAFACLSLCLFLLQWLFVALALQFAAASRGLDIGFGPPAMDKTCSSGADGARDVPPGRAHDHSDCCILCKQAGRDASLLFVAALLSSLLIVKQQSCSAVISVAAGEVDRQRIGWGSSWSPRAPPAFV